MARKSKSRKSLPTREQQTGSGSMPPAAYTDWTSFQAWYGFPGHPSITPPGPNQLSAPSSPQGHPYMWPPQVFLDSSPTMFPYGALAPAYVAVYPPWGLYPYPHMPMTASPKSGGKDMNSNDRKKLTIIKRFEEKSYILTTDMKGFASGMLTGETGSGISSEESDTYSGFQSRDEVELKRLRRKKSNRNAARRSRMRKRAADEEIVRRHNALKEENDTLRKVLERTQQEHEKLALENVRLNEEICKHPCYYEHGEDGLVLNDLQVEDAAAENPEIGQVVGFSDSEWI